MLQRYLIRARDGLTKLKDAASKAVELDDGLPEAHIAMGAASFNDWNFPGAESESKRAIALDPNDQTAHGWYGYYLSAIARYQEYETETRRAYELDPLNLGASVVMARALWRAGRETEAFDQLKKTTEMVLPSR
jgi:tetratricopeptide (TPR) repeat protein